MTPFFSVFWEICFYAYWNFQGVKKKGSKSDIFRGVKNGHFGKSAKFDGTLEGVFFRFFQKKTCFLPLFVNFWGSEILADPLFDIITTFWTPFLTPFYLVFLSFLQTLGSKYLIKMGQKVVQKVVKKW